MGLAAPGGPWRVAPIMRIAMKPVPLVHLLLTAALTGGCASSGGVPQPFPRPGGASRIPPSAPAPVGTAGTTITADGYALAGTALGLRGAPYRNGGADPRGFDCSGFIEYVYAQHGIHVPRTVLELFEAGVPVPADALESGDLLFFSTTAPGPTHVGLSIGGDEFVHAPSTSGVVRVERLRAGYWGDRFIGARRILNP